MKIRRARIYIDEAGTHGWDWLIIGMLFVNNHAALHSDLVKIKNEEEYFNRSPKRSSKYKETHLNEFRNRRDASVAMRWIDSFLAHDCYFRSIVIDWKIWQGKYFGGPFEPEALKRRRAYKKWAEMLLHPEARRFVGAKLYLDRLRITYGYDVLDHLRARFTGRYEGNDPWISSFQATRSWLDANQCLQLCDLIVGCIWQQLMPSTNEHKLTTRDYLYNSLAHVGVAGRGPRFWKGYSKHTLTDHFPKYSEWYWRPDES
jgi:hypothetical protein